MSQFFFRPFAVNVKDFKSLRINEENTFYIRYTNIFTPVKVTSNCHVLKSHIKIIDMNFDHSAYLRGKTQTQLNMFNKLQVYRLSRFKQQNKSNMPRRSGQGKYISGHNIWCSNSFMLDNIVCCPFWFIFMRKKVWFSSLNCRLTSSARDLRFERWVWAPCARLSLTSL